MIQVRGYAPIIVEMALSDVELRTLQMLAKGMTQKEIAYEEKVSASCISQRIERAMERNQYTNKHIFIAECIRLINLK